MFMDPNPNKCNDCLQYIIVGMVMQLNEIK